MSCYKTMVWLVGVVLVFIMVQASDDEVKKVDDLLKLIKNVEELERGMNQFYYFPQPVWTEKACDGKDKTIKGTYAQYLYPTSDFNKAYMFWIRVDNKNINFHRKGSDCVDVSIADFCTEHCKEPPCLFHFGGLFEDITGNATKYKLEEGKAKFDDKVVKMPSLMGSTDALICESYSE